MIPLVVSLVLHALVFVSINPSLPEGESNIEVEIKKEEPKVAEIKKEELKKTKPKSADIIPKGKKETKTERGDGALKKLESSGLITECVNDAWYGGIGVYLGGQLGERAFIVYSVAEGYPAFNAGVMPGDILIPIDDHQLDGVPGSEFTLQIRSKDGSYREILIRREKICVGDV